MGHITVKSIGGRRQALRASPALSGRSDLRAGAHAGAHASDSQATGLHAIVFVTMVASLTIMMIPYFVIFWHRPDALFMIAISFGFLVVYVCVPIMMLRFEFTARQSLADFIHRPLTIWTGRVTGGNAWLQICMIPVMLAFAAICLCIVISVIRP